MLDATLRRNALAGIYCFLGCFMQWHAVPRLLTYSSRNALAGIYCFLGGKKKRARITAQKSRNALAGIYCFLGVMAILYFLYEGCKS